ncbi:MAG: hypothetical protein AB1531_01790 [Chloroflexota bacterium]
MEKRYKVLRFIGSLYKVVGIILGIVTIIGALGSCVMSIFSGSMLDILSTNYGYSSGAGGLLSGLLGGVIFGGMLLLYGGITSTAIYAFGELLYLLIDMEENTRATTILLNRRS